MDPTPRTHFRNAVAMALGEGAVVGAGVEDGSGEGGGERGEGFPTHLQRMEGPLKRGRKPGSGMSGGGGGGVGQGPRIKYCKRRVEAEPKLDDATAAGSEGTIVVKKPHKSKAQLAALERRRRLVRKKG